MVPAAGQTTAGAPGPPLWQLACRRGVRSLVVDPVPLIILGVVVGAAAVLLPFLVRLHRSARQALEAVRGMEAQLDSLRAQQHAVDTAEPPPPPEDPARE